MTATMEVKEISLRDEIAIEVLASLLSDRFNRHALKECLRTGFLSIEKVDDATDQELDKMVPAAFERCLRDWADKVPYIPKIEDWIKLDFGEILGLPEPKRHEYFQQLIRIGYK